jgi:hypothetical protein
MRDNSFTISFPATLPRFLKGLYGKSPTHSASELFFAPHMITTRMFSDIIAIRRFIFIFA